MKRFKYTLLLILLLSGLTVMSQQQVDKERLKEANTLFDNEEFLKALDIYRQLLSVSPEDQLLNYRYGACLIYSDEDTKEPVKYLKYGASNDSDPLAYYFLGKALHLNYQFADAQLAFSSFIAKADSKLKDKYSDAELLLEMTKNGQTLLSKVKDIIVLDKTEASEKEFFRSYNLDDIGGKIIVTPAELLSKRDKESGENSLIYFQGAASDIYFSSYGNEDQRDIYRVRRLDNGKFTKAIKLSGGINTNFNENYPFMHPDGVTLYFSSMGHNSMGGYDIFKSILDPNTGAFGPAENLDFAVSSPDDDLFYIADLNKDNAYFASGRSSELGRLNVYHVKVRAGVANLVVIKGSYLAGEGNKPVRIRIEDAMTNNEIGAFKSDPKTGEYLISLPRSGKYKFYVEEEGENTVHSGLFEIPRSSGSVAYGQEMTFTNMNGTNQLVLNNLFDKPLEDDITVLMADALKQKAQLDVNMDEFEAELANETPPLADAYEEAGFSRSESNESIIEDVKSKRDHFAKDSKADLTDAQMLFAYAQMKKDKARSLLTLAKESFEKGKSERVLALQEEYLLESAYNKKLADKESQDASNAISMLKMMDKSSKSKHERYTALEKNLEAIETSIFENDYDKLVRAFTEQKEINNFDELPGALELLQEQNNEKRRQTSRALEFAQKLEEEEKELSDKLVVREKLLETTTKKKDREIIEQDIIGIEDELADYQIQTEAADKRYETRIKDQSKSEEQVELLSEYKLRRENDLWSNLEPREYSKQELTEFDKDMRLTKRESKEIEIGEVEIAQILSKREDLSHKFEFGEVVRGNEEIGMTEVAEELVPDDLEFIEKDEDSKDLIVISKKIEKDDDYKIFLVNTEKGNDQVSAYDNKIAEYNEAIEDASPEETEILENRITRLTSLKTASITKIENEVKANLMSDFSDEIKVISDKELIDEEESSVLNWIDATYLENKDRILNSDKSNEVKQQEYDGLNTTFKEAITKSKVELMYLYTIKEIAGTVKAKKNLDFLESLEIEYAESQIIPFEEEVVEQEIPISDVTIEETTNLDKAEDSLEDSLESANQETTDLTSDITPEEENVLNSTDDSGSNVDSEEVDPESTIQTNQFENATENDASVIIIPESSILTTLQKQDLAKVANVTETTQANISQINNINEGTQLSSEKVEERLETNNAYLVFLESKRLEKISSNSDQNLTLENVDSNIEALDKLILSTRVEMDRDRVALAASNDVTFTQRELSNSRYREDYIEELAKISANSPENSVQIKQKVMLNNMVAFDLEEEIENTKAQLEQEDISKVEQARLEIKLEGLQKDYNQIRQSNMEEIALLNDGVTEADMYERQKFRSYNTTGIRDTDYSKVLTDVGYKKTKLNSGEAKQIQDKANQELIILETQKDDLDAQTYMDRQIALGEKMAKANSLEIQNLENSIENVNIDSIGDKDLSTKAKDLLVKAQTWKSSARNLEQLSINAVGSQKNQLLKDKLASQLNAIEYTRHAQAIVNYANGNPNPDDSFVFTDFVIPNHEIAKLNTKPDYDLADELFSRDYKSPNFESEATAADNLDVVEKSNEGIVNDAESTLNSIEDEEIISDNTTVGIENTITDTVIDNVESKTTNIEAETTLPETEITTNDTALNSDESENIITNTEQIAIDSSEESENTLANEIDTENRSEPDSLKLLNASTLSIQDLQDAQIRLNMESIKQIQPINVNGVLLSAERTSLLNNNPEMSKSANARAYFKKQELIEQIQEMTVEQIDLQKVYADKIYTKEQGLVVVKQSLVKDGTTEILVKEHNRLVAELTRLNNLKKVAEGNVLKMDSQIRQEETSLTVLKMAWEEEKALDEFVVDDNLLIPTIPDVLIRNVYVKSSNNNAAYSNENPIPVDPVMPEGVVYQVQVGAYRQPIPQDLFKGFAPIMGQRIQSGITRYKVGLFTSKSNATTARDEIRSLGYSDAFVVVFNGGKKITIAEAQQLTGEILAATTESENDISNTIASDSEVTTETASEVITKTVGTGIEDLQDYTFVEDIGKDDYYDDSNAAEAKQVEMIKGLFFTVQIGAYSNPVTADKLQNVSPLNSELTENGLIRYTTGIYRDINGASEYKQEIVERGISDAFVSAYYNGFRINLSKARDLIASQGDNIMVDNTILRNGDASAISNGVGNKITNSVNTIGTSPVNSEEDRPKDEVLDAAYSLIESGMPGQMIWDLLEEEGLLETVEEEDNTFKVILGPFVAAIPTREVEIILNFRDNIRFEERADNAYVYSSINPIPYDEARNLKETLEKEGITTAKIVSFKGDREISMKEFLDELSE